MPIAITVHSFGGPGVLLAEEQQEATCPPGHIRVRVDYAGVNFIDVYKRNGAYPSQLPFVPGQEIAGTITEIGSTDGDSLPFAVGDRVVAQGAMGGYTQSAIVPWQTAVKIPTPLTTQIACALMLQGLTAHYLVNSTYPLAPLDTCLVHAAAGGVGLLLVQLAKRRGATVIGITSTAEKAERVRQVGADHVIIRPHSVRSHATSDPVIQQVRDHTAGRGVDVVYDSVGRDTFQTSLDCLRPRGMLALYGQSSGAVEPFDPQILSAKGSLFLTRPSLFHHVATYSELGSRADELFSLVGAGKLDVAIFKTLPLQEAAQAHTLLESRATSGKILLDCR